MLKEFDQEEFDELSVSNGVKNNVLHEFAKGTVREFLESGYSIAEVTGWPEGEPRDQKTTSRYTAMLRRYAHDSKHRSRKLRVMQRKNRVFIMRESDGND